MAQFLDIVLTAKISFIILEMNISFSLFYKCQSPRIVLEQFIF